MPHDMAGVRCAPCVAWPPLHAGVRAAVAYGPVARRVALKLKYGGRLGLASTMAQLMARHVPPDVAMLVPVPLHPRRMWQRGFNQSMLIARGLTTLTGVSTRADALVRRRATPVLRGLGPDERRRAVASAFVADGTVKGQGIALIDDVYTTGATADACTSALLKAGAASVTILCWARVLSDAD